MAKIDNDELVQRLKDAWLKRKLAEAEAMARAMTPAMRTLRIKANARAEEERKEQIRKLKNEQLVAVRLANKPRRKTTSGGISNKALVPKRGEKAGPLTD